MPASMTRREVVAAAGAAAAALALPRRSLGATGSGGEPAISPVVSPAINCAYLTGGTAGWPLADLSAAGYRALELTPDCLVAEEEWRAAAERAGMRPSCVNAMHALRPYLTGSLSDAVSWRRMATLDGLLAALARMRALGIPFLVVAPSRLAENYQSAAEARALLIQSLRALADAGPTQILLQAAPFRMFASSAEIASLVDEAARPNVAAALDTGHAMLAGESPDRAAGALGARLRYVQVHDVDTRPGVPLLDGHLPFGGGTAARNEVRAALGDRPFAVSIAAPGDPLAAARGALEWLAAPA